MLVCSYVEMIVYAGVAELKDLQAVQKCHPGAPMCIGINSAKDPVEVNSALHNGTLRQAQSDEHYNLDIF